MYPRGPGGVPCIGSSRFLGKRNSRRYARTANANGSASTPSQRPQSGNTSSATRDARFLTAESKVRNPTVEIVRRDVVHLGERQIQIDPIREPQDQGV